MGKLDYILNLLLPDNLTHLGFKLADRFDRQHVLGIFLVALCTLAFNSNVGQAGIGTINQAKVSNNGPVPQNTVIAQPQMLLLLFDQYFYSPAFEVIADQFLHGKTHIVGHQCDNCSVTSSFREYNFHTPQLIHGSNALSQFVARRFPEALDTVPPTGAVENVLAVRTCFVFGRVDRQPTIGLTHTDIPPFSFFAGIDHLWTEIERIEQNGYVEPIRNLCISNDISGQYRELLKWNLKRLGVLFLDVQPGAKRNGHASVPEAGLENRMSVTVLSGGVMVDLSDGLHFLGPFNGLGVIDNQQALFAALLIEPLEHTTCLMGNHRHFVKLTSPQEFAMIGSVRGVPQQPDEPVDGRSVANADRYDKWTIIGVHMGCNPAFDWLEKSCCFLRNFTDSKHKASMLQSVARHNTYRHSRLLLFNYDYLQNRSDRSV
jgi:hypothetical protein